MFFLTGSLLWGFFLSLFSSCSEPYQFLFIDFELQDNGFIILCWFLPPISVNQPQVLSLIFCFFRPTGFPVAIFHPQTIPYVICPQAKAIKIKKALLCCFFFFLVLTPFQNLLLFFAREKFGTGQTCFLGGSDGKESACNTGNPGSILRSANFLGEGNGNPLQYSSLENSLDRACGL